jgi:hypothetical protein
MSYLSISTATGRFPTKLKEHPGDILPIWSLQSLLSANSRPFPVHHCSPYYWLTSESCTPIRAVSSGRRYVADQPSGLRIRG